MTVYTYAIEKGTIVFQHVYPVVRTGQLKNQKIFDFGAGGCVAVYRNSAGRSRWHEVWDTYDQVDWTKPVQFVTSAEAKLFGVSNRVINMTKVRYSPKCYWGEPDLNWEVPTHTIEYGYFRNGKSAMAVDLSKYFSTFTEFSRFYRQLENSPMSEYISGHSCSGAFGSEFLKLGVSVPPECIKGSYGDAELNDNGKAFLKLLLQGIEKKSVLAATASTP